jgi:outer membrane protein TolC
MSDLPPYPRVDARGQRATRLRVAAERYRARAAELRQTLQGVQEKFADALDAADARKSIEERLDAHAKRSGRSDKKRLPLGTRENR